MSNQTDYASMVTFRDRMFRRAVLAIFLAYACLAVLALFIVFQFALTHAQTHLVLACSVVGAAVPALLHGVYDSLDHKLRVLYKEKELLAQRLRLIDEEEKVRNDPQRDYTKQVVQLSIRVESPENKEFILSRGYVPIDANEQPTTTEKAVKFQKLFFSRTDDPHHFND